MFALFLERRGSSAAETRGRGRVLARTDGLQAGITTSPFSTPGRVANVVVHALGRDIEGTHLADIAALVLRA